MAGNLSNPPGSIPRACIYTITQLLSQIDRLPINDRECIDEVLGMIPANSFRVCPDFSSEERQAARYTAALKRLKKQLKANK